MSSYLERKRMTFSGLCSALGALFGLFLTACEAGTTAKPLPECDKNLVVQIDDHEFSVDRAKVFAEIRDSRVQSEVARCERTRVIASIDRGGESKLRLTPVGQRGLPAPVSSIAVHVSRSLGDRLDKQLRHEAASVRADPLAHTTDQGLFGLVHPSGAGAPSNFVGVIKDVEVGIGQPLIVRCARLAAAQSFQCGTRYEVEPGIVLVYDFELPPEPPWTASPQFRDVMAIDQISYNTALTLFACTTCRNFNRKN